MKLNQLNTQRDYATVITGANVDISYRDGLFLYHAFMALRENMTKLSKQIPNDMADVEGPETLVNNTAEILQSMDALLMPIAEGIVIPKEGIDIYNYVSPQEKEHTGRISLKKKRYDMDADVSPVSNN